MTTDTVHDCYWCGKAHENAEVNKTDVLADGKRQLFIVCPNTGDILRWGKEDPSSAVELNGGQQ